MSVTETLVLPARPPRPAGRPLCLDAVVLPDGEAPTTLYSDGERICRDAIAGAGSLPGRFALPGLVDAHAHVSMRIGSTDPIHDRAALVAENLDANERAGVLAVRDAGWLPDVAPLPARHDGPVVVGAAHIFAPAGRYFEGLTVPVEEAHLVEAGLAEAARTGDWVKVIADFPGPDMNWFAAPPCYSPTALAALVEAVHGVGGRVMAHVSSAHVAEVVRAGVDAIEHGPAIDPETVREMARRGTAWTPTLSTVTRHLAPYAAFAPVAAALAGWRETLQLASALGVTLMTGTDEERPGTTAREAELLVEFGVPAVEAVRAASTGARRYLGLPLLDDGAPADIVTYDDDPRLDITALARPRAIVRAGVRIL